MAREKLFIALQNVCDFTPLESEMDEIERAIIMDDTNPIRMLLESIKALSDEEIIHAEINEFLDDYEFTNRTTKKD